MKRPEDLGVHVIYTGPQIADAKHQIEVIEELIGQEVDLLAVAANDPVKLLPVLEKARNEGIRVITWDSDTRPEGRTFFVNQVDAETFGRHLMDTLAMNVEGEKGPFAIVTGSLSAANLNEWIKWIQVQQKEFYPGMELVDIVPNDENAQKGFERTMELLERHPDLKGIIGSNSLGPLVAAQAVRAKGLSEEVAVVGASPPGLVRDYLKEGVVDIASMWSPTKLGYLTVVLGKQLLDGQMPHDGQEVENVGSIRVKGDIVIMGEPLDFTRENVDQYDF